jgi:hypothetical protein
MQPLAQLDHQLSPTTDALAAVVAESLGQAAHGLLLGPGKPGRWLLERTADKGAEVLLSPLKITEAPVSLELASLLQRPAPLLN